MTILTCVTIKNLEKHENINILPGTSFASAHSRTRSIIFFVKIVEDMKSWDNLSGTSLAPPPPKTRSKEVPVKNLARREKSDNLCTYLAPPPPKTRPIEVPVKNLARREKSDNLSETVWNILS